MGAAASERNGQLIVAGVLLIVFGLVCAVFPGLTLGSIAFMVGAGFIVSGAVNFINYRQEKEYLSGSIWLLAYGIIDVLIGIMFIIHPLAFSMIMPWLIGGFVCVFGIFEVIEAFALKRLTFTLWGWSLVSGIVSLLIGILFFVWPELLAFYVSAFALWRGVSLIILGANSRRFV